MCNVDNDKRLLYMLSTKMLIRNLMVSFACHSEQVLCFAGQLSNGKVIGSGSQVLNLAILQDTKSTSLYSDIERCLSLILLRREVTCKAQ